MTVHHQLKKQKKNKDFQSSSFIICPVCGKNTFQVIQRIDDIPYFGEVLETFASCDSCKYKTSDVLPLEDKKSPVKQEFKVSTEDDLKVRLIKSKHCIIEIPEINLKIEPGSGSEAYITNVEGLLIRIENKIKSMKAIHTSKSEEFEKILKEVEKMKNAEKKFTIRFDDSTGISKILSKV